MGFEISCPDISAVTGMTAPFFFLFFTNKHLKINHNFYSETSVLVLGICLRTPCIVHYKFIALSLLKTCSKATTRYQYLVTSRPTTFLTVFPVKVSPCRLFYERSASETTEKQENLHLQRQQVLL